MWLRRKNIVERFLKIMIRFTKIYILGPNKSIQSRKSFYIFIVTQLSFRVKKAVNTNHKLLMRVFKNRLGLI